MRVAQAIKAAAVVERGGSVSIAEFGRSSGQGIEGLLDGPPHLIGAVMGICRAKEIGGEHIIESIDENDVYSIAGVRIIGDAVIDDTHKSYTKISNISIQRAARPVVTCRMRPLNDHLHITCILDVMASHDD